MGSQSSCIVTAGCSFLETVPERKVKLEAEIRSVAAREAFLGSGQVAQETYA